MGALDGRVAIITGAGRGLGPRARAAVRERGRQGRGERPRRRHARRGRRPELGDADRRRDQGDGRRGGRQRRERRRLGRRAAAGATGGRHVRRPARAREQRRHPARPRDHQHDRGRVGRGDHRAPEGSLRADASRRRRTGASRRRRARTCSASIIHTTSTSGLFSNPGQANYDAAKSGIATLSQVCAKELVRYGVRSNAIAPGGAHPAHRGDARARRRGEGARRGLRRVGPGATSRRSSRTSPPPTARSPARASSCRAARCSACSRGTARRRSRRTTAGRSRSSRRRRLRSSPDRRRSSATPGSVSDLSGFPRTVAAIAASAFGASWQQVEPDSSEIHADGHRRSGRDA